MREIEGSIFSQLFIKNPSNTTKVDVAQTDPLLVQTFNDLVKKIAILSFHNKDHLLFFRGQEKDHVNAAKNSSFYPSIYRTNTHEKLSKEILEIRFRLLNQAASLLITKFNDKKIISVKDLERRKLIQWSILQHYEVCDTPLLDVTQSLRVACSFALPKDAKEGFIFVFGFPYITNRISINSEQDIVLIRLINICPPEALRPYFQESFLAGTADVTVDYEDRTELDFKRRLIAKFRIPNTTSFWEDQKPLLRKYLMPEIDEIKSLCTDIKNELLEENNIQAMFPGKWLNTFTFKDGRQGSEVLEIKNGNEYHALGKRLFLLDSISINKKNNTIRFRKVGIGTDHRKAINSLRIIDSNTYEGEESVGTAIVYKRIE